MGEGIANEILGNNDSNTINYPSGYGANMFAGGSGGGGGGMSEAEMMEAAIAASLQDMQIGENADKTNSTAQNTDKNSYQ